MLVGLTAMEGCSTAKTSRVVLLDRAEYKFTDTGEMVGDFKTPTNGIWFSRGGVEKLQKEAILP